VHCDWPAPRSARAESLVDALGLLQTNDVGLPLGEPSGQVINALLDQFTSGGDAHDF
jgi:hypothetical protein